MFVVLYKPVAFRSTTLVSPIMFESVKMLTDKLGLEFLLKTQNKIL